MVSNSLLASGAPGLMYAGAGGADGKVAAADGADADGPAMISLQGHPEILEAADSLQEGLKMLIK